MTEKWPLCLTILQSNCPSQEFHWSSGSKLLTGVVVQEGMKRTESLLWRKLEKWDINREESMIKKFIFIFFFVLAFWNTEYFQIYTNYLGKWDNFMRLRKGKLDGILSLSRSERIGPLLSGEAALSQGQGQFICINRS